MWTKCQNESDINLLNLTTSLPVQWLRLHASTAGGTGLVPGQGIKIPHAVWCSQKKKKNKIPRNKPT